MGLVGCCLVAAGPAALVLWLWGRPLLTGRWRRPGWFVATAVLGVLAAAVTWFIGAFAGGLDPEESCHTSGTTYDPAYRAAHWREPSRWFPLHDRCNADYDLVPAWVNPALVLLAVLVAACLGMAARLAAVHHRARKRERTALRSRRPDDRGE
ncbi:hypothetical protein [Actinoplanes aureus]|uniref:Uncharacterized protein n=1 Tax=Actinoplanes aureus TaxID=2792083 RepID=A0A931G8I8_9ACTN|nr:hypothetical protein [Actinoplanes aureus]MBG0569294.1 hypothetical protein [Actinoplanes aureus]